MNSTLLIMKHKAYKAGLHYDLRIQEPKNTNKWYSWRLIYDANKELIVPMYADKKEKIKAVQTTIHTRSEAYFTGTIPKGEYGGGIISKYFESKIDILKYSTTPEKGYFVFKILNGKYKNQQWVLFKMTRNKFDKGCIWIVFRKKSLNLNSTQKGKK